MKKVKYAVLQSLQHASHEIKYHKQLIESTMRQYRDKTKGDVLDEMLNWYDFINALEHSTQEIRRALLRYHDMHDVMNYLNLFGDEEQNQ